jgi:hypothetical protein
MVSRAPVESSQGHRGFVSWDGLGAALSLGCAVHCASLPLLFGLWPGIGLVLDAHGHDHGHVHAGDWLFFSHQAEGLIVGVLLAFASIVLAMGWLRHRQSGPALLALPAALLLLVAAFGPGTAPAIHVGMQVLGGIGIGLAHVLNLRALRPQACCPARAA